MVYYSCLAGSYYESQTLSKVGITIQEEVDAYYALASSRWNVWNKIPAEEVVRVLAQ